MKELDTWWKLIVKKINIIKIKGIYKLVERPERTNIIGVK